MIQLTAAGKRFGPKVLFQDLNWLVTPRDRVGLVGANGTGKTTLLKVLAGAEGLDYGTLTRQRGTNTGYLPQDGLSLSGNTVFAECLSVFSEVHQMQREMEELAQRMAEVDHASPEYAQIAERFHRVQAELHARNGYSIEAEVGAVLNGLGFRKEDWERRTEEFSGGWQMRIALAKLLLQKPNLLLLDEPTNHLDLESRNWLEQYLAEYPHAYVLISHDRYFLDVTVNKTMEIWNKQVHVYSGNYEKYLAQKAERRAQLEAAYRNQHEKIEQLEAFINRFRAQATKAKQVQSRIKELERMEKIEVPPGEKAIHFKFPQPTASGRQVAEARDLGKSYGEKHVFSGANFVIERGDRIALVGVNGAGKSTLIRLLAAFDQPTNGEIKLGHNVEVDYFAQDQYKALNPQARMLDDLFEAAPRSTQTELRSLLGCFLFSEDDVFKTINVLSGGERNRYALARMLLHPSNFLLLDEPTNHLDLRAKDVLLESLQKFTGTVVFVSHDRYFIDKLATRVFEIGGGQVEIFPGNYEDYLWRKQGLGEVTNGASGKTPAAGTTVAALAVQPASESTGAESLQKRVNPIKLRQMKDRCQELEEEIARLEAAIAISENALQSFVSVEETKKQSDALDRHRTDLAASIAEWEELAAVLEGTG
ncbi:MAG TPA: ABC-F family ATP-binding cassette domain-containing protein [Candidatus Saccharimonadales bacterium]|jgi:ATP-binding cassette subfamily F protein 3|nr:ABC-F family ATP-binding cassette domain-containing protein [Candidatus Saccharimonadales bacterium]